MCSDFSKNSWIDDKYWFSERSMQMKATKMINSKPALLLTQLVLLFWIKNPISKKVTRFKNFRIELFFRSRAFCTEQLQLAQIWLMRRTSNSLHMTADLNK